MATAELNRAPRERTAGPRVPARTVATWRSVYRCLWLQTLAATALIACAGQTLIPVRRLLGLKLTATTNPPPDVARVLALAAHNTPIAAWPLLLGLTGAHRNRHARRIADSLVLAALTVNTLPVAAALAAYGTRLLAYIPQLPLEWAALALGATGWVRQRREPLTVGQRLTLAMIVGAVMLCAATVETVAVPHRRASTKFTGGSTAASHLHTGRPDTKGRAR